MSDKLSLYLVSDCSGETVSALSSAVIPQFGEISIQQFMWPLVRSTRQIDMLIEDLKEVPGIVLYTMIDRQLRDYMHENCASIGAPCISAVDGIVNEIISYQGARVTKRSPGKFTELNQEYMHKIDVINYTMQHDDGQSISSALEADIILTGVSRTSKTPTAFYLAHRGYKTANIPLVMGTQFPVDTMQLRDKFVIGLYIEPQRLMKIRKARMNNFNHLNSENEYTDLDQITKELSEARKFMLQHNIPQLDITQKAVEETTAEILSMYHKRYGHLLPRGDKVLNA